MFWIALLVVVAAIAASVVYGRARLAATYLSFPCRACQREIRVAKVESIRRLTKAKEEGKLGELGQQPIPCPRCGSNQVADWLMHPGTQEILRGLEAHGTRKELAQEFVSAMYDDGSKLKEPQPQPPVTRERS